MYHPVAIAINIVLSILLSAALSVAPGCHRAAPSVAATAIAVTAAGDLYLGGTFDESPLAHANGFLTGEVRFANLEGPITDEGAERGIGSDGKPDGSPVALKIPTARAAWLTPGFTVLSIENNHALDQGASAHAATLRFLQSHSIAPVDAAHPAHLKARGQNITVFARAFSPGGDPESDPPLEDAVRAARATSNVLISLHWGHTGAYLPTPHQQTLAHRLVDAGAAAILGHGPHTLQGVELYRRGIIAYSLGNLAFGCQCTNVTDSLILDFSLQPDGTIAGATITPLIAGIQTAPLPLSPTASDDSLLDLITTLSESLHTRVERSGQKLLLHAPD